MQINNSVSFSNTKENLIQYIRQKAQDYGVSNNDITDFFIESMSALNTLANYNLLSVQNNSSLETSNSREAQWNLISNLGYSLRRKVSATVRIKIILDIPITNLNGVVVPQYTNFDINGYNYILMESFIVPQNTKEFELELLQGIGRTLTYRGNGSNFQTFSFGNDFNVEDTSVKVNALNNNFTIYRGKINLSFTQDEFQFFSCSEYTEGNGQTTILFGEGQFRFMPNDRNEVNIEYIETEGDIVNNLSVGLEANIIDLIEDLGTYTATTISPISGGQSEELLERAIYLAPKLYAANDRIVRLQDYKAHILKFSDCIDCKVWNEYIESLSKREIDLKMMNKIYYSILPNSLSLNTNIPVVKNNQFSLDTPIFPGSCIIDTSNRMYEGGTGYLLDDVNYANCFTADDFNITSNQNTTEATNLFNPDERLFYQSENAISLNEPVVFKLENVNNKTIYAIKLTAVSISLTAGNKYYIPTTLANVKISNATGYDITLTYWDLQTANTMDIIIPDLSDFFFEDIRGLFNGVCMFRTDRNCSLSGV
ncbi:MAG: hypothetical protein LBG48_00290 [Rickettsiales bacterium]|jgi:hypothetical protein|nr:hypothetical protein [Rickettsiales bacterium]